MNLICVICSELLIASDDIFSTLCGHVFHHVCLLQWLERSKTCPQCREKTNSSKILRLYFNFPNNDVIKDDICSLQHKLDKLTFDLTLKDKDIKQYLEKTMTLEKENNDFQKEIKKIKSKIKEKETAIIALKEQLKYFQQLTAEIEPVKQEAARLKKKLEELKTVQKLLDVPPDEVENVITKDCDADTLYTYIILLKRELDASFQKRKELRTMYKNAQRELTKISLNCHSLEEEHIKRKKLEEELIICEKEKIILQNKLQCMESKIEKYKKTNTPRNTENKTPSAATYEEKKMVDKEINTAISIETLNKEDLLCSDSGQCLWTTKQHAIDAPLCTQGILGLKKRYQALRAAETPSTSVLAKRPKLHHNESREDERITYNGLGGHSKYDRFPNPLENSKLKKVKEEVSKHKKNKLDVGDNKKLSDLVKNILTSG